MDIIPWEKSEHHGFYTSTWGRGRHRKLTYPRTVEYLDDDTKQYWRKGDIIKFDNGRKIPWKQTWESWFLFKDDWLATLPWNGITPKYAEEQYAVIAGRYRIVKNKRGCIYKDYGVVIMMITGPKKGHMRKYYLRRPFEHVCKFPYNNKPPRISMELIDSFMEHYEDSNESRNAFLECLYKKIKGDIT